MYTSSVYSFLLVAIYMVPEKMLSTAVDVQRIPHLHYCISFLAMRSSTPYERAERGCLKHHVLFSATILASISFQIGFRLLLFHVFLRLTLVAFEGLASGKDIDPINR
jgi:hypothetical protein